MFTCGPGTDELELLATTVPNMGGTAHLEMELPRLEDIEMDPASALATVNGIYEEGNQPGKSLSGDPESSL